MVTSVSVDLAIGENTISWREASGYANLEAKINVTDTSLSCVTMNGGVCSLSPPEPYVSLIGFTLKGFLAEAVADVCAWIDESGVTNLTLNHAVYVLFVSKGSAWKSLADGVYALLSPQPSPIDSTIATLNNAVGILFYSKGVSWYSLGNSATGCSYT